MLWDLIIQELIMEPPRNIDIVKFWLHVLFDEEDEPVGYIQETSSGFFTISSDMFDYLVAEPNCLGISTLRGL
jgi:hypothetical protein